METIEFEINRRAFTSAEINLSDENIAALRKQLILNEWDSAADHYFDSNSNVLHKIVLHGEEPAGFFDRPQSLFINWKEVMGMSLPGAVFATVSAVQIPWLAPFAVLAVVWDLRSKLKAPLNASYAIVIRAIWETQPFATSEAIHENMTSQNWRIPGSNSLPNVERTLDILVQERVVEIKEGRAFLLDYVKIAAHSF